MEIVIGILIVAIVVITVTGYLQLADLKFKFHMMKLDVDHNNTSNLILKNEYENVKDNIQEVIDVSGKILKNTTLVIKHSKEVNDNNILYIEQLKSVNLSPEV